MKLKNAREVIQALLDGKKIKWSTWGKCQYLFMNNGLIVNENLVQGSYNFNDCNDLMYWETMEEKEEKVFYEWMIKVFSVSAWHIENTLLTEEGYTSRGNKLYKDWDKLEKIKLRKFDEQFFKDNGFELN